jgi:hypothetical protein
MELIMSIHIMIHMLIIIMLTRVHQQQHQEEQLKMLQQLKITTMLSIVVILYFKDEINVFLMENEVNILMDMKLIHEECIFFVVIVNDSKSIVRKGN